MERDMRYDFPSTTPVKPFPEEMPIYNDPCSDVLPKVPFKEFPPLSPPTIDGVTDTIPEEIPRKHDSGEALES